MLALPSETPPHKSALLICQSVNASLPPLLLPPDREARRRWQSSAAAWTAFLAARQPVQTPLLNPLLQHNNSTSARNHPPVL